MISFEEERFSDLRGCWFGDVSSIEFHTVATVGEGDDTADSEACSTGGVRGSSWSLHTLTRSCHVSLLWTRRVERLTWELVTHRPRLLLWTHSEFLN